MVYISVNGIQVIIGPVSSGFRNRQRTGRGVRPCGVKMANDSLTEPQDCDVARKICDWLEFDDSSLTSNRKLPKTWPGSGVDGALHRRMVPHIA